MNRNLVADKEVYSRLCNIVNGAMKSCKNDHGHIVVGSASKRIVGQLLGAINDGTLLMSRSQLAAWLPDVTAILKEFKILYSTAWDLEMAAEIFRLRKQLAQQSPAMIKTGTDVDLAKNE